MLTFVFGTVHEPMKVLGETNKDCLAKIKKYYVDNEIAFINHNKRMVTDLLEFGDAEDGYQLWVCNEAIEESGATITEINGAKSMSALELVLQTYYDLETKIVEEKFNTKK